MSVGAYRVRTASPVEAAALPETGADLAWIAEPPEGGAPAGHAAARLTPAGLLLTALAVSPEHRGRGVGATLLAAVLDQARWRYEPAVLAAAGAAPRAFLARHGFVAVRADGLPDDLAASGPILARRL